MSFVSKENSKKQKTIKSKQDIGGLCLTCKANPYCTYKKERARAIVFCDEFEDTETLNIKPENGMINQVNHTVCNQDEKVFPDLKGLCVNCEIKERCDFPKPEWGVWHCEEYK